MRGPEPFRFRLVLPQVLCPAGNRANAWPGGTQTAPPTAGLLFSREEVKKEENKTRKKETGAEDSLNSILRKTYIDRIAMAGHLEIKEEHQSSMIPRLRLDRANILLCSRPLLSAVLLSGGFSYLRPHMTEWKIPEINN